MPADKELTLDQMRAIHARGESVLHKGRIIPPGRPLPDELDLAGDDPEKLAAVKQKLEDEQRENAKKLARLAKPKAEHDDKPEPKAPRKD